MTTPLAPSPDCRAALRASGAWNDRIITDYFDATLEAEPQRTALVAYRAGDERRQVFSYAELDRLVARLAAGLAALGLERGEVVSCQLPNWWQMTALYLACSRIGALFNPLMPIFRERELLFMLGHAHSRVLVVPGVFRGFDYAAMAERLRGELPELRQVLVVEGAGANGFERLLERPWEEEVDLARLFAERRPHADDLAQLLFTSGTTGEPKGVLHTSNTLLANVRPYAERLGLGRDDVVFMASPMAHQTGFLYGLLMPFYLGGSVVLQDIWDPRYAARVAERERPTFTMASTPFLADLLEIAHEHRGQLASLRIFVAAGAPIPEALVERAAEALNACVVSAWGMTEAGAVTMTHPGDGLDRAVHTDGAALPWMQVRVVDDAGAELPRGAEGHLQMRGASLFVGYLGRPELYDVDADGWFATGDLARMNAEGYIRITGRTKDVVIRGGENIPVVEVENLLYKHPAVSAVALVGCPDARLGERLCAYVTLHEGEHQLSLEEVVAFLLEQRLARNYLPEYLEVLAQLPRTPAGKIQKFKLRERAQGIRLGAAKRA